MIDLLLYWSSYTLFIFPLVMAVALLVERVIDSELKKVSKHRYRMKFFDNMFEKLCERVEEVIGEQLLIITIALSAVQIGCLILAETLHSFKPNEVLSIHEIAKVFAETLPQAGWVMVYIFVASFYISFVRPFVTKMFDLEAKINK